MSTVTITLLGPVVVNKPNASKSYQQMTVTHQVDGQPKPDGKKIFDFTTPKEVWDTLLAAKAGDRFEIDRVKDAKEGKYWEWKAIRPAGAATPAASPATPTSTGSASSTTATPTRVGNWETPEERAQKQIYIVRQSSVSNAIEYTKMHGGAHIKDVLDVARQIENYVFGAGVAGLTDDMPE